MLKNKRGFTLMEVLIVIAIIGIMVTIAVIALGSARAKSRDARRVADIKQIRTALELYFNDTGRYPDYLNAGEAIAYFNPTIGSTTTYMNAFPAPLTPPDGGCSALQNQFAYYTENGASYTIDFCLGAPVGSLAYGPKCASPAGVVDGECYPAEGWAENLDFSNFRLLNEDPTTDASDINFVMTDNRIEPTRIYSLKESGAIEIRDFASKELEEELLLASNPLVLGAIEPDSSKILYAEEVSPAATLIKEYDPVTALSRELLEVPGELVELRISSLSSKALLRTDTRAIILEPETAAVTEVLMPTGIKQIEEIDTPAGEAILVIDYLGAKIFDESGALLSQMDDSGIESAIVTDRSILLVSEGSTKLKKVEINPLSRALHLAAEMTISSDHPGQVMQVMGLGSAKRSQALYIAGVDGAARIVYLDPQDGSIKTRIAPKVEGDLREILAVPTGLSLRSIDDMTLAMVAKDSIADSMKVSIYDALNRPLSQLEFPVEAGKQITIAGGGLTDFQIASGPNMMTISPPVEVKEEIAIQSDNLPLITSPQTYSRNVLPFEARGFAVDNIHFSSDALIFSGRDSGNISHLYGYDPSSLAQTFNYEASNGGHYFLERSLSLADGRRMFLGANGGQVYYMMKPKSSHPDILEMKTINLPLETGLAASVATMSDDVDSTGFVRYSGYYRTEAYTPRFPEPPVRTSYFYHAALNPLTDELQYGIIAFPTGVSVSLLDAAIHNKDYYYLVKSGGYFNLLIRPASSAKFYRQINLPATFDHLGAKMYIHNGRLILVGLTDQLQITTVTMEIDGVGGVNIDSAKYYAYDLMTLLGDDTISGLGVDVFKSALDRNTDEMMIAINGFEDGATNYIDLVLDLGNLSGDRAVKMIKYNRAAAALTAARQVFLGRIGAQEAYFRDDQMIIHSKASELRNDLNEIRYYNASGEMVPQYGSYRVARPIHLPEMGSITFDTRLLIAPTFNKTLAAGRDSVQFIKTGSSDILKLSQEAGRGFPVVAGEVR